uniref:Uncharacterized protein n=1 Tax=Anguilla anguilla TaxID=7936 RepID=A0A0E9VW51_ANGAN
MGIMSQASVADLSLCHNLVSLQACDKMRFTARSNGMRDLIT